MNKKERLYYFIAKHCKRRRWQRYFEKRIAKCCKISGYNGFAYSEAIRIFYKEVHGLEIGYGCFGDCWCNPSLWWKDIKIGRYCSFAQNLYIATANHPLDMFTTHPVAYCQEYGAKTSDFDIRSHGLEIGHGVWIGQSVLIMPGCFKIGNGAIVGGGVL